MLEVSVPIAHELLGQCIKQGQALVQRASLVGDFTDYESWKAARKQWIDPTKQALEHMYDGQREARDFAEAVTCREEGNRWQQQYAADLECVERALELLTVIQSELAFDPGNAPGAVAQVIDARPSAAELAAAPGPDLAQPHDARPPPGAEPSDAPPTELDQHGPAQAPLPERALDSRERWREPDGDPTPPSEPADERQVGAELARSPSAGSELAPSQQDVVAPGDRDDAPAPTSLHGRRVFIAHGRDERWKQAVAHLLAQTGSEDVTILNDHPEQRAELREHIGERTAGKRYAIVLLTADEIGAARLDSSEEPYFTTRPGQSVVFEMGFLIGALTPGCVCILYEDGVELPCELTGISHVRLDLAGSWQPKLLLTLRRAGFDYDLNRLVAA
jgi:predicted nucleotide-binding protein